MTITYGDTREAQVQVTNHQPVVRLGMENQTILSLKPTTPHTEIQVWSGKLWVTQAGDTTDYFLTPGDTFQTEKFGLVVIQALKESVIGVSERVAS